MDPEVGEYVHDMLNNALANGFDEQITAPADDVALELWDYDETFERNSVSIKDLIPHVKSWQAKHAKG